MGCTNIGDGCTSSPCSRACSVPLRAMGDSFGICGGQAGGSWALRDIQRRGEQSRFPGEARSWTGEHIQAAQETQHYMFPGACPSVTNAAAALHVGKRNVSSANKDALLSPDLVKEGGMETAGFPWEHGEEGWGPLERDQGQLGVVTASTRVIILLVLLPLHAFISSWKFQTHRRVVKNFTVNTKYPPARFHG